MAWRDLLHRIFVGEREYEKRSEWGSSAIPNPSQGYGPGTFANVDLRRTDTAQQKVAIWAAQNLICSLASSLPVDTFTKAGGGPARPIGNPRVVDDPGGDGYGGADWIEQYLRSALSRGNVYGTITALESNGYPSQITLYNPDDVRGYRDTTTGQPRWFVGGLATQPTQMWHQRYFPQPGNLLGMSPIEYHATTIGQGIAAARFGAQFFTDGAHPSSMFTNELADIDDVQARAVKAKVMATMYGSREPLVFGRGWKREGISVTPEESQFLETQRYTGAECCRIYGPSIAEILGYDTGGSMTYANVEQRSLDLLVYTLDPWLVRLEKMFTALLPKPQFVKFNRNALLRTSNLDRFKAYSMALTNQWLVVNEVREKEDLGPVPWGDKPYVPQKETITPDGLPPTGSAPADQVPQQNSGPIRVGAVVSGRDVRDFVFTDAELDAIDQGKEIDNG